MKKLITSVVLLFFTIVVKAHSPANSTTMLVENENHTWVLQISTSLTAFQQEVRRHYADTPYKTPEEFQQMVIDRVKKNLEITFNGSKITLSEGVVKLGHETKVVFEVFGVPNDISSVSVRNTIFEDVHRDQSTLLILKEGFTREKFVLNKANNHTLDLEVNANSFQLKEDVVSESSFNIIPILLVLVMIGILVPIAKRFKRFTLSNTK